MAYSSFVDPGTAVIISWDSQDEVAISSHRIEFFNGWDRTWSVVAELPGEQRSFEWIVPDVGFVNNSSHHTLRVIALDPGGQEGWDEHQYFIPTGTEPGTLTVTGLPAGPFLAGQSMGPLCVEAVGTNQYIMIDAEWSFDGDQRHIPLGSGFVNGCLVLAPSVPFISTDTARIRVNTEEGQNKVNYFFSDTFTIRPDPRLGDGPPTLTLTGPLGGETFPGGGVVPIHWSATDDEGVRSIDIQTSTDGGRTWHFIAEALSPMVTSFNWQLPPSGGLTDVRVRVMVSDLRFQTSSSGGDRVFSVSAGSDGSGGNTCTAPPGEVENVSIDSNKETVLWSSMGGGVTYNVVRGNLSGLASGTPGNCVSSNLTETFRVDLEIPTPGTAFYYLIGAANDCGAGPWGPPEQSRTSACP